MRTPPATFPNRLREFYDREKIAAKGFACPHQDFCESAAGAGKDALSHGSEAYVGSRYGELTKVVVVALDAGGDSLDLAGRRIAFESTVESEAGPQQKGTLHLIRKLLSKELTGGSPIPFFAMIHAAKCSRTGKNEPMPDEVFKQCRTFAKAELSFLEPDLIVTQGEPAQRVLDEDFPEREVDVTGLLAPANTVGSAPLFDFLTLDWLTTVSGRYLTCVRVAERNVYALHTPNPSDPLGRWLEFEKLHLPICVPTASRYQLSR
jgi:hypothetical protein